MNKNRIFSAPTVINLELTEACNIKCRHCYNFWRDESAGQVSLEGHKLHNLLKQIVDANVFHVVLSGGEPFAKFKTLIDSIKFLTSNNISVSCNSNLMLATPDKIKELVDSGLDHILTSWYSYNGHETDFITAKSGSHEKLLRGIEITTKNGIRVSANTIVTQHNKHTIYDSGELLHNLGVQKFFAHRVVPPAYDRSDSNQQHYVTVEEALYTLDELLRLKEDTGISVGTLISYPLCMLGDLVKYRDFVGRGCPSQSGHRFSINPNGNTHCCVMEDKSYGNVFNEGLITTYKNTQSWRDNSYHYIGCKGCDYLNVCESGCRMTAFSKTGKMDAKDPLMLGHENITVDLSFKPSNQLVDLARSDSQVFYVNSNIRMRKEDGFYLLNIQWGNTIIVDDHVAEFIQIYKISKKKFNLSMFGKENSKEFFSLIYKNVIICDDLNIDTISSNQGVSLDPSRVPDRLIDIQL